MPEIGDVLTGKYRLERLIGKGGMGAVYEAEHLKLGKRVAIKIPHDVLTDSVSNLARFEREPRAAAATGHRGIVDIHDIGATDEGCPFVVMELLEGESLGELLEREPQLDIRLATYIVAQVLSALDAAHAKQIIHRDLKPDNVFLVDTGHELPDVKILDFGTCKLVGDSQVSQKLTQSGVILGTPLYMAPEQVMDEVEIDHRSDLYSVGALFYQALTGRPPFVADNVYALIHKVLENPLEPPSSLRPELPANVEEVVLRALARDRDDRFGSAAAMLQALLPMLDETGKSRVWIPKLLRSNSHPGRSPSVPEIGSAPTTPAGTAYPAPTPMGISGEADTIAVSTEEPRPRATTNRTGLVVAIVVVLVVAVAAAMGMSQLGGGDDDAGAAALVARGDGGPAATAASEEAGSPSQTDDAGSAAAPDLVTLTIEGVPEGGEILLDGARLRGSVMRLHPDVAGRDFVVRVGDETVLHEMIVLDADITINVGERIAAASPPDQPGKRRPVRRPGNNGGTTQPVAADPGTEPPPGTEKQPTGPLDFVRDPDSVR